MSDEGILEEEAPGEGLRKVHQGEDLRRYEGLSAGQLDMTSFCGGLSALKHQIIPAALSPLGDDSEIPRVWVLMIHFT